MTTLPPEASGIDVETVSPGRPSPTPVLRTMGLTTVASVGVQLTNAVSGVLIARLLSASGKGAVTSILSWAQLTAWVAVLGFPSAMTYLQSRRPELGRRIVGTSLVAVGVFGTVGILAGAVLVTLVFADQPAAIRTLAQVFVLSVLPFVLLDFLTSISIGNHDFTLMNAARILQPATYVALLVALSLTVDLTVGWVLAAALVALTVTIGVAARRVVRTIGIGRPSAAIFRENVGYGLKVQGGTLAGLANQRLDILVMPIVLSASSIGVYSVAVNVSAIVLSLVHSLATVVFPVATGAGDKAPPFIGRALRTTTLFAAVLAAFLFLAAPTILTRIYGEEFGGGVTALRILLVGYVCMAGSTIIVAGLKAANRPLAASASQLAAVPITIVGLWLVLERYGIEGAAAVSTVAYVVAFSYGLVLLSRQPGYSLRGLLSVRALRDDVTVLVARLGGMVRRRRRGA